MTLALHEVDWKMMNPIPRQCEMKTIFEEPSSTGNLNKVVIHSLSTYYFVNTPLMLNGGSISFPFCQKPVFLSEIFHKVFYMFTFLCIWSSLSCAPKMCFDFVVCVKPQSDIHCNRSATSPRLTIFTDRRGRNKVPDRSRRGCREVGDWTGTSLRPNQSQPGFCACTKTWLRLI